MTDEEDKFCYISDAKSGEPINNSEDKFNEDYNLEGETYQDNDSEDLERIKEENKNIQSFPKDSFTIQLSTTFKGNDRLFILSSIVDLINNGERERDFDTDDVVTDVFHRASIKKGRKYSIPATNAEIGQNKRVREQLGKKRAYVRICGKVLSDILTGNNSRKEIVDKYDITPSLIRKLIDFLRGYYNFKSQERFPHISKLLYKSLSGHQIDVEPIVKANEGEIIDSRRDEDGRISFLIDCNQGHDRRWVLKHNLIRGSWCPICIEKTLNDHQIDIEPIVRVKGGRIIGSRRHKTTYRPFFHIECNKRHDWWVFKYQLKPNAYRPSGSWCPICANRISAVGKFCHILIEYYCLTYFYLKNCTVMYEESLEEGGVPDFFIYRNNNFKENIEKYQNIIVFLDDIEIILLDFTIALTPKAILGKCFRGYQNKSRVLLIILMREDFHFTARYFQNLIYSDTDLDNEDKENIKVINYDEYLIFLGLGRLNINKTKEDKKIESKLLGIIKLAKKAIDTKAIDADSALTILNKASQKYAERMR